jgi:hypothetical protein
MVLFMFAILTMIVISMEAGVKEVAIIDEIVTVIGQNIVAMKIKMRVDDIKYTLCITHFTYSAFDNTFIQVKTQLYDSIYSTL